MTVGPRPPRSELAHHWSLDPGVVFLNHGSFGACPVEIQRLRQRLLDELEANPMDFYLRRYPDMIYRQWSRLEGFLGAEEGSIVFVENATEGVSTVLRSLDFGPGDILLTTTQEYFSSRNALFRRALGSGAGFAEVRLPFPAGSEDEVVDAVLHSVTERTRLVLLDHVSSPTGMVLPVKRIAAALAGMGVETMVDGAHGPGMLPLDLADMGISFYTGNCHKWLCSPKSCAVLYVRPDRQDEIHPLATSRLPEDFTTEFSPFQVEFFWGGTADPTPMLCVDACIEFMGSLLPGGWSEVMERNRSLASEAGRLLCSELGVEPPLPEGMTGALYPVPLPWKPFDSPPSPTWADPLQDWLWREHGAEVPVTFVHGEDTRILRISAQLYNCIEEYGWLAGILRDSPHLG
jgi:isopenicillin-N epimerase